MKVKTHIAKNDCSIDGIYYKKGDVIFTFNEKEEKKIKKKNVRLAMRIDLRWTPEELIKQLKKHDKRVLDALMSVILTAKAQQRKEENEY